MGVLGSRSTREKWALRFNWKSQGWEDNDELRCMKHHSEPVCPGYQWETKRQTALTFYRAIETSAELPELLKCTRILSFYIINPQENI